MGISNIIELTKKGLTKPPKWLPLNTHYQTIMGSVAYGVSSETSDVDIYGFCIPPKEIIFPHLSGEIIGFGRQIQRFEQFQQHHIKEVGEERNYDISIYSIIKYFQLIMENNPNMIDSLFTPTNCEIQITRIGQMVKSERKMFLHKGSWHKFKGYAYSQVHKMKSREPVEGKRKELIEKFGYDVKFAYHVVRLLDEVEQIMREGDIDLQRNREQLKSIRRGEWKMQDIEDHFSRREKELTTLYNESKLPHGPDEEKIKTLLLKCLEEHYGSLDKAIVIEGKEKQLLNDIKLLIDSYYD
jgi:predicted nucleotidyltransferase